MLIPVNLCADYMSLSGEPQDRIIASKEPVLSWGGYTDIKNNFQTSCHVIVKSSGEVLWDSGVIKTSSSFVKYSGAPLPVGKRIDFSVSVSGSDGVFSPEVSEFFYIGSLEDVSLAKWICASEDMESVPVYFNKKFTLGDSVSDARIYVASAGFCHVSINGCSIDSSFLGPAHTEYNKTCLYTLIPEVHKFLCNGENTIDIILADGWRRNNGEYLKIYNNTPAFFGTPCLWAAMNVTLKNGQNVWITTDETWMWGRGNITFSHLFDGEQFDARMNRSQIFPVSLYMGDIGILKPMMLPPIREKKVYKPISIHSTEEGKFILDFGTNFSGVIRIRIPCGLKKGSRIILRHGQLLNPDGTLNAQTLRGAKSEDAYIASGDENGLTFWQPMFTCHGFRYAEVSGYPYLNSNDVSGIMLCTDLTQTLEFNSGSAVLNAIHNMLLQTEKCTNQGAANDTCGRSERMHWLDDGINRYPEIACNFDISRYYRHLLMLIRDTQENDGSITCTAPYIYGKRPGDPLSSSYLLLAEELFARLKNIEILKEYYPSFCRWENCLLNNSTDYILNYSYYGDWAGPEYSRDKTTMGGGAGSLTIPAVMVGTAMSMYTAKLLKQFAEILGKAEDVNYYSELFGKIKEAFLNKWYDPALKKVHNGSLSCSALALWLDIIPHEDAVIIARNMKDELVNSGYRFTTGAFCLQFMCHMLIKFGYVDEFYELMTREEYPSFGYMLKCGATTGWEKYEYLTGGNMNAHIHALQVSVFHCFYKHRGHKHSS